MFIQLSLERYIMLTFLMSLIIIFLLGFSVRYTIRLRAVLDWLDFRYDWLTTAEAMERFEGRLNDQMEYVLEKKLNKMSDFYENFLTVIQSQLDYQQSWFEEEIKNELGQLIETLSTLRRHESHFVNGMADLSEHLDKHLAIALIRLGLDQSPHSAMTQLLIVTKQISTLKGREFQALTKKAQAFSNELTKCLDEEKLRSIVTQLLTKEDKTPTLGAYGEILSSHET